MRPFLLLRAADLAAQRPDDEVDDVHFTEALAESVITDTTQAGDVVLDPFAGYGTTVAVAERMGRHAIGVELLAAHVAHVRARTAGRARVVHGDARRLTALVDGPVDLVLTSPPYMSTVRHPENPLTGYATDDGDYDTYLAELGDVFGQVATLLRPGGHAVVNVANLVTDDHVTTLAWDVGRVVAQHLTFLGETFLCWDEHPPGLVGDYLLWFRRG
jgi:DNA modification methylase